MLFKLRYNVLVYLYGQVEAKWPGKVNYASWMKLDVSERQNKLVTALLTPDALQKVNPTLHGKTWHGYAKVRASPCRLSHPV